MACNDPFHPIFDDIVALLDGRPSLYTITVRQPGGALVNHRLPSYNREMHENILRLIQDVRSVAVREVAAGTRNGFDLLRIDRDAERLERRSMGKRYGATVRRKDAIGSGSVVERGPSQTKQRFTAAEFMAAVKKQR